LFRDENGNPIDQTQPIRMFDGVKLIAFYLEYRYKINPDLISKTKLTELLKIFDKNDGIITVEELYEYIIDEYRKDKNFFIENYNTETDYIEKNLNSITENYNASKPFGQYGEVILNQIGVSLKENLKHLKDIN
jgi:hypothetical protein